MKEISSILRSAYKRLSDHFVDYIKVYLVTGLSFISLFLIFALVSLSFFAIAEALHLKLLYFFLVPLLLTLLFGLIYLSSWCGLVTIDSIVGKIGVPIKKRFTDLRPFVMGFVRYNILFSFFIFGLIPMGILSIGTVFIFWAIASSFAGFVYLQHKPKGLSSLWVSLQMMKGQFTKLITFILIVYGIVFIIDSVLLRSDHFINNLTSWIMNLIAGAYFMCIKYNIYKEIPYPKIVHVRKNWLLASKIGFIISVIIAVVLLNHAIKTYPAWDNFPKEFPNPLSIDKLI